MSKEGYEKLYIQEAFDTNWIAPLGPNVNEFEKEIALFVNSKAAAALSTGTSAIHLALIQMRIGKGDKVFCSSLTFSASTNPIVYQNAVPIFIDSEPNSFNMSPIALEKAFEKHTPKAVIVVNIYGQSADMDKIKSICDSYGVPIIEDAAESLGATYKGKMSGTFGKFGVFSFNGNKIITTSGGGMLVSDDDEAIRKVRFLATQAREDERHYQHSVLGYNYRMSNVSAGIGRGQLKIISERIEQKKAIYNYYKKAFKNIEAIQMAPVCDYGEPNYWLSVMIIDSKCRVRPIDVMIALENNNIESRPVWKPMHLQPFYKNYEFFSSNEETPISEDIFNRGVCLPSDTNMDRRDMEEVVKIIIGLGM